MLKMNLPVSLAFLSIASFGPLALAMAEEMPEVQVRSKRVRAHDEVTYSAHSVSIEQPASDSYLGETLGKLPGVLVRNSSGFGSATTVITAQALGSGGTAVSIDDIPVVESSGRGVNFSLFPSTLISGVEHQSPFYQAVDPSANTLPAPGGRINLKTLRPPRVGESRWVGALTLGSGNTLEATGAYRGGDDSKDWVAALTGYSTQGNYPFRDPNDGNTKERANNDASAIGALLKHRWNFKETGSKLEVLDLLSTSERTNPGPLTSPTRQHQRDMFNLLGLRYGAPTAFGPNDGIFAKTAGAYARTGTQGPSSAAGPSGDTSDSRSWGHYVQGGYVHRQGSSAFTFALDNQLDYLRKDEGVFNRNVFGVTGTLNLGIGDVRVIPLGRFDASSKFPNAGDGAMTVVYSPGAGDDIAASYALQHAYPSITASSGFSNGGFTVVANPDLRVQRDGIVALTYNRRRSGYTLYSNGFYDLIRNRSTFSILGPTTAQFVNASEVSVLGYTLDGQLFPMEELSLRASATVQRAWDRATGHEMPYKPRFEGWASVSYVPLDWLALTAQEQWTGKRFVSTSGVDAVAPFIQTIFRLDAKLGEGVAYFKVSNVFDTAAFENPGFPTPGRTYWLGYTVGRGEL